MLSAKNKELIEAWVNAFNKADADAIAALYSEGATNHLMTRAPVIGRPAIQEAFRVEFIEAQMFCIVQKIKGANHWATLEWQDPNGLKGHGYFEIEADQIVFQRGYWDKLSFLKFYSASQANN